MSKNLSRWARAWRMLIGLFFTSWWIAGGPLWTAPLGLYFLAQGSWGFSPLKALMASLSPKDFSPRPLAD